jgi:hypothetical protein
MNSRTEARIGVHAPSDRIWELVADLPHWSGWNPHESVEGRIGFGAPLTLTERFPEQAERTATVRVSDWTPLVRLVWTENRGWLFGALRYFEIDELEPGSCLFASGIHFSGLRGEWHYDKHRGALRAALQEQCDAIKRLAES